MELGLKQKISWQQVTPHRWVEMFVEVWGRYWTSAELCVALS